MPTYQYACTESACGHRFEAVQAFSDDPLTSCPVCEGRLRKVFSAVGVVFKGSGFYRTDSREKPKATASKDSGKSEQKTSASSSDSSGSGSSSGSSTSSTAAAGSSSGSTGAGASGSSGSSSKTAAS